MASSSRKPSGHPFPAAVTPRDPPSSHVAEANAAVSGIASPLRAMFLFSKNHAKPPATPDHGCLSLIKKRRACNKLRRLWFATSPRLANLFFRPRLLSPPFRTPHRRPTMRSLFHSRRRRPNRPIRQSCDRRPRPADHPRNAPVCPPLRSDRPPVGPQPDGIRRKIKGRAQIRNRLDERVRRTQPRQIAPR